MSYTIFLIYLEALLDGLVKYSNIFLAIAAIAALFTAKSGVDTWKNQFKVETARKYLRAVYSLRDAMKFVRNPFIPLSEMETARKEYKGNIEGLTDHQITNRSVYEARWKKVREAWSDLEAQALEAEALWGREIMEMQSGFIENVKELLVELQNFLNPYDGYKTNFDLIYDRGEKDLFSKKVEASIRPIEDHLRPHLK